MYRKLRLSDWVSALFRKQDDAALADGLSADGSIDQLHDPFFRPEYLFSRPSASQSAMFAPWRDGVEESMVALEMMQGSGPSGIRPPMLIIPPVRLKQQIG